MKQWSALTSRVSLAPPISEAAREEAQDKWADPPMPRDYQLLLPHTQQLLRIARSGKFAQKRKAQQDLDADDEGFGEREEGAIAEEILGKANGPEERAFVAKKWRPTPDSSIVPDHLHWEFLAKRRKGLPNFYHGSQNEGVPNGIPQMVKRKTRVQRVLDPATGESVIYSVLALEGQHLENELPAESAMEPAVLAAGTVIEGLGTVNADGVIDLTPANPPPAASRRARPPPKKKGGPGRGKKRVTFTNPDGSTYTTIVPNATKIVPKPGQVVRHVAKGEEAGKDVSMEEAAKLAQGTDEVGAQGQEGGEEGDGHGEGDDDGDDDEDDEGDDGSEEGEIADEEAPTPAKKTSVPPPTQVDAKPEAEAGQDASGDVEMKDQPRPESTDPPAQATSEPAARDASSSPDLPLAQGAPASQSRQGSVAVPADGDQATAATTDESMAEAPASTDAPAEQTEAKEATADAEQPSAAAEPVEPVEPAPPSTEPAELPTTAAAEESVEAGETAEAVAGGAAEASQEEPPAQFEDGEEDLLGSLERSLES